MNFDRGNSALLAGVCSRMADWFQCNVWVLRAVCIFLLMVKTLLAAAIYAALALLFRLIDRPGASGRSPASDSRLYRARSPGRSPRIEELDRRFREWEQSLDR